MEIRISPIRIAAQAGLLIGLFLVARFFAFAYSLSYPLLSLVYLIATAFVPYLQYRYIRGFRNLFFANRSFSWIQGFSFGFYLMFFASILVLIPYYYYYSTLLPEQFPQFIEMLERSNREMGGILNQYIQTFQQMYQQYTSTPIFIRIINDWGETLLFSSICSAISSLLLRRNESSLS